MTIKKEHLVERDGKQVALCECGCGNPAAIATKTQTRFGWVKCQPMRFIRGHANRRNIPDFVEEDRGWATPCWIWNRGIHRGTGYGQTRTGANAHRVYFERFRFKIWPGHEPDHLCRQRDCVHPYHQEPVTHQENMARSPLVGRWKRVAA